MSPKKAPPAPETPEPEVKSFEVLVRELGTIVERLEQGDLPLEDSLDLFERGVKLSREAQERLDAAERRVEELLGFDENGRPVTQPVDLD